ncbi:MAG: Gfo/Idh/MocA family oxidoreductase [Ruminococcaceae bacterium]|nr:Gfo/Idh/MocA family oxidoreductase [Oscillospiraceae bacterium]
MSKLKIGIIGTGSISNEHIRGYLNNPDVELYAFCDIDADKLNAMGKKYGVTRLYTDKDEMLKLSELDAVSVCTWNAAHAECTIAALNAGKHVLCEKPTAMNTAEAQAMKDAAEKNGKILMIGFVRRHGNDCALLKDFIEKGEFGELYYGKAKYLRRNGCPGGWFGNKEFSGGGPLIDLGVHVIDMVKYLAGNPKPVSVYGFTFDKLGNRPGLRENVSIGNYRGLHNKTVFNVEDFAGAIIRFDNGFVLSVEASFSLNEKCDTSSIELFGTKSGARLDASNDPPLEIYTTTNGYLTNTTFFNRRLTESGDFFAMEMNNFVDAVLGRAECKAPAQDGVDIMKILDAIYESARTGHEVVID